MRLFVLHEVLGDDLLSHGETPHYHRRYVVSLQSSGRDLVVPTLYLRQANWLVMTITFVGQVTNSLGLNSLL